MSLIAIVATAATASLTLHAVDLDRPGALETLKASNADHYRRAVGIINASYGKSCQVPEFDRYIRAKFDAKTAACGALVKTSYPPQRQLSFVLDGTVYSKTVYFEVDGKVRPADWTRAR